jgi:F-type H+-transporting ATPase subunit a
MQLNPDSHVFWQYGFLKINSTIVFTWLLMALLAIGAVLVTTRLSAGMRRSRWQNILEIIVLTTEKQIAEVGLMQPRRFLGFIGTLFLFVALASLCTIFPFFKPPTGSLSTTVALALCVLFPDVYGAYLYHAAV